MKTLEDIWLEIDSASTVMNLKQEHAYCMQLVQYSLQAIGEKWSILFNILDRLEESHADAIYDMTAEDDFSYFVTWARGLAGSVEKINFSDRLNSTALMFSVKP